MAHRAIIGRRGAIAGGTALIIGTPLILRAQPKIHVGHGFAMHGEPLHPTPDTKLDFLNSAAPKGGAVK